jgi:2-phospho-L-lactate guanylyltransferase
MATAVVIPLRSFAFGKERLTDALNEFERAALVTEMATNVVVAAGTRTVVVVSSALEVLEWATALGLACIDDPGTLDGAAAAGLAWARAEGFERVVIAHGDLPFATSFDGVEAEDRGAVIVPDQHDDGTPVLSLPTDVEFTFAYGPGSAARHIEEARRCHLDVHIVRDEHLAFDVDTPADLAHLPTRK